jgi:hypothetical protein
MLEPRFALMVRKIDHAPDYCTRETPLQARRHIGGPLESLDTAAMNSEPIYRPISPVKIPPESDVDGPQISLLLLDLPDTPSACEPLRGNRLHKQENRQETPSHK